MLTTRPHLTVLRPSSTTVSYTVSTSLSSESFTTHATHWLLLALRVSIGLLAIFILLARYLESTKLVPSSLSEILVSVPWTYIAPSSLGALYLVFRRFYTGMSPVLHVFKVFAVLKAHLSLQKSPSWLSALSVSKPVASRLTIFSRLRHASSRPRRSGTCLSTKLFEGLRWGIISLWWWMESRRSSLFSLWVLSFCYFLGLGNKINEQWIIWRWI